MVKSTPEEVRELISLLYKIHLERASPTSRRWRQVPRTQASFRSSVAASLGVAFVLLSKTAVGNSHDRQVSAAGWKTGGIEGDLPFKESSQKSHRTLPPIAR